MPTKWIDDHHPIYRYIYIDIDMYRYIYRYIDI